MEIYLTDLASYNNGNLVGEWISLPMSEEELNSKINKILELGATIDGYGEIHEEWYITDYECDAFKIEEYDNIFELNVKAEALENLNDDEREAVRFLLDNGLVSDFDEALSKYEDVRIYKDSSMEDIAYDYINECYNIETLAPIIANNIDYEKIGRDLEIDGSFYQIGSDIFEYMG